jgi:hypothetical protein
MGITRDSLRVFQWLLGMKMGLPPPPVLRSSPVLRREVVWQTLAARGFHGTRSGTSTNGAEGHVSLWVHLDLINIYIYFMGISCGSMRMFTCIFTQSYSCFQ